MQIGCLFWFRLWFTMLIADAAHTLQPVNDERPCLTLSLADDSVSHLCCSGWRGGAVLGTKFVWPGEFDLGWLRNLRWACSASVLVSQCVLQLGDGSTSSQRSLVGVDGLSSGVISVSSGWVRLYLIACLVLRREFAERLLVLV